MKHYKTFIAASALALSATAASAITIDFDTPMAAGENTSAYVGIPKFSEFAADGKNYIGLSFTADNNLYALTQFTINPYNTDLEGNPANSIAIAYSIDGSAPVDLAILAGITPTGTVGSGGVGFYLLAGQTVEFRVSGESGQSGNQVTFAVETTETPAVPLPAAGFLMVGALGAMGVIRRKKKNS
ncbi:VPLPA-CTERM sorting domain-containing protein [Pseudooceanicola onchidii]|uniref:VPLPA-CTERM sorting domain-containing protein n=1 Tax=Pseudooceanicola onchidii TaxID=2562279 RepID=UPI0010AAF530|nr:VPLPA-CTERM sorting domain-containing protein [Pseudooceanicola onchidii]